MMELAQLSDHVKDARIGHVELVQKSTIDRRIRPESQQMQTREFREASQPLALVTKMEGGDVEFGPTMGPLKLFESSNHTFAGRSILGGGVRQSRNFDNTCKSTSEDGIAKSGRCPTPIGRQDVLGGWK